MKAAQFYEVLPDLRIRCLLCPRACEIAPGGRGACGARLNEGGALVAESYGAVTALALDPIEKKPLRRFHPGALILSLGGYGCNLRCPFCQNHRISTGKAPHRTLTPEAVSALSQELAARGNIGVAYTYNEPLIGYEFVADCARQVKARGQQNVLVTNGYVNPRPLLSLLPLIDAMNIDLKAFRPAFYEKIGGGLEAVKETVRLAVESCHVEVTTLVIPGENDGEDEMRALCAWLAGLSPEIPLHVSRFFPAYRLTNVPPTPVETVRRLAEAARESLRHVYTGNC